MFKRPILEGGSLAWELETLLLRPGMLLPSPPPVLLWLLLVLLY